MSSDTTRQENRMMDTNRPVLVIGATGFLGRRVVAALQDEGRSVRCLARTPEKAADLTTAGAVIVKGDMLDAESVEAAVDGVSAVIVCVHTISPQGAAGAEQGFMDVEAEGLRHVATACTKHGVGRVLYVTSIGVAEHAPSSWLRGRWQTEKELLSSGLDVTIIRPGMIVGRGGDGFGIVARAATKRFAVSIAGPRQKFRTVAVDDLAHDIVDLIDIPGAAGAVLEVGSDDVLTMREMAEVAAASIGRRPGITLFIPGGLIRGLAPLVERVAKVPHGAIAGFVGDATQDDMVGDPSSLRALLGRSDRPFREAIAGQLS
jgi:uncharacterized protein YbjT (DUF2867 family)